MSKNAFVEISRILRTVNEIMAESGFETNLAVSNDNFKISGKEVTINMPFIMKLTIPISEFEGSEDDISRAVSQAISQVVSRNK